MRADQLRVDDGGCHLDLDGRHVSLTWRWLRDHARDETSFHNAAQQRVVPPGTVAALRPNPGRSGRTTRRWSP